MDAFSYLFVLVSIILGLAIEQVLQAYRAMVLSRERVRWHWLSIAWSAIMLLIVTQNWWASFGLVGREEWSFAQFAALLLQTILMYMLTALVLPDMPDKGILDLDAHYYRQRPFFFGLALLTIGASAVRERIVEGHWLAGANLLFHLLFAATAIIALLSRRPLVHRALAVMMGILSVTYIVMLFAEL